MSGLLWEGWLAPFGSDGCQGPRVPDFSRLLPFSWVSCMTKGLPRSGCTFRAVPGASMEAVGQGPCVLRARHYSAPHLSTRCGIFWCHFGSMLS